MQYNIPQFVDVEDKIIGPLTLKQFLILVGGGLVIFFYWSLFKVSLTFFVFTLPTVGLFAMLAFGKFNGRPMMINIAGLIKYFATPKYRIFMRTGETITTVKQKVSKPVAEAAPTESRESRMSKLKSLAYLLDQKTAEEERLIHSGKMDKQWIDEI